MTKQEFLDTVAKLYRVGSDSDRPGSVHYALWTKPEMAAEACCMQLDGLLRAMVGCAVITEEERQTFYDNL